jgi:hypothetical protein
LLPEETKTSFKRKMIIMWALRSSVITS